MPDLFYNPYKPRFDNILIINEYDNPEYTCIGDVKSFIYKKWHYRSIQHDGVKPFTTPDDQLTVHFKKFGKIEFIEINKDWLLPRHYIGGKHLYKPNIEQPMSYYKQFYSGGIHFIYDEENKLIEYFSDLKFKGSPRGLKRIFQYDDKGNMYVKSDFDKLIFNEAGQVISITHGKESDGYYSKTLYYYNENGRIEKKLGYGYLTGEDEEDPDEVVYYIEKGIQLLYTGENVYTAISEMDTLCVINTDFGHNTEINHLKHEVIFDSKGFKKYHRHYTFDGSIDQTNHYNFLYDQSGNWINAVVDITFGADKKQIDQKVYQREFTYI